MGAISLIMSFYGVNGQRYEVFGGVVMKIEAEKIQDILMLTPCDSIIDASSAADFKGQLVTWIQEGNTRILLDLSFIVFIDSSGLGAIISLLKLLTEKGDICLCNIGEQVMSLFKLTRMDRIFRIYPSSAEALEAMKVANRKITDY